MKEVVRWHFINFTHSCGNEGTILHVLGSQDGEIAVECVCVFCASKFMQKAKVTDIISSCAIRDYELNHKSEDSDLDDLFANGKIVGKEN